MAEGWDAMARWYDDKQGEEGDLWHRELIDPTLWRVIGDPAGLDVLDLGCGNGYVARRMARAGARVTGVDASPAMVERARAHEARQPLGITYLVADAARLDALASSSYDLVVSNMVLMNVEHAEGAIHEASRVLRPGGRFVASLSHPCFDIWESSGWQIEMVGTQRIAWRKVRGYRQQQAAKVPWRGPQGETWETWTYHRPLSWYFRRLREAGLAVTAVEEPEPTEAFLRESPQVWIADVPLHCVFEAIKVSR